MAKKETEAQPRNIIFVGKPAVMAKGEDGKPFEVAPAIVEPPTVLTSLDYEGGRIDLPSAEVQRAGWYDEQAEAILANSDWFKSFREDKGGKP